MEIFDDSKPASGGVTFYVETHWKHPEWNFVLLTSRKKT